MSQLCFICNKFLTKGETVTVSRGMKTLIDASIERGDEFVDYLRSKKSVTVRVDCWKSSIRKSLIAAIKRRHEDGQASTSKVSPPRTRARVSESDSCFKKYCLSCGDEADEETEKKSLHRRQKMYKVATLSLKESVLTVAQDRSDDVSKAVTARINFEYDLVAVEAKYHDNCYKSFPRPNTSGRVGRPQDEAANSAMEEIYKFIESSDDWQFTLDELKNVSKNIALDNRTI